MLMIVIAALCALAVSLSCSDEFSGDRLPLSIGSAPLESSALIYIAEDQGFFTDSGLDVELKKFDTGAASLNGLLKGEVDIATPAEYALAGKALEKQNVSALATIDEVQYFFVIARSDRGVKEIADLKGKRIGVVRKTTAEFYLGRFLEVNGSGMDQIVPVDIDVTRSEELIMNGDLDAVITRPPYVDTIEKRLGENAVVWPAQNSQPLYAVLVGENKWIDANSETLDRLFAALMQAEEFVMANPAESKAIVQERLDKSAEYMEAVWPQNQFSLRLEQPLILMMEDQARWMIANGLTAEKTIPDFMQFSREDRLRAAKPEAVSLIR